MTSNRLTKLFNYLRQERKATTWKSLAVMLDINYSTLIEAKNGNKKYLTKRLLDRFNLTFGNIFSIEWWETGEGEMLKSAVTANLSVDDKLLTEEKKSLYNSINQLTASIATLTKMNTELVSANVKLNEQINDLSERISELSDIKQLVLSIAVAVNENTTDKKVSHG